MNSPSSAATSPIEDILSDLRVGRMVIMVDDEDRENEGDLLMAAEHASADAINFMARFGRGLICLTLTREHCERLQLPPMTARNGDKKALHLPSRSKLPRASAPASQRPTGRARCSPQLPHKPAPKTWCSRAIFFRFRRWMAAC